MKCTSLALAAALWGAILLSDAAAQPILNRVEQFIRDQIDAGRPPAAAQPRSQPPSRATWAWSPMTARNRDAGCAWLT